MKAKYSIIAVVALVLLLGGTAAFADSGQGRTPSYAIKWDASMAGDTTGVSGVASATPVDSAVLAALKSANVSAELSPAALIEAANSFVNEDKFGEGGRPLDLYY